MTATSDWRLDETSAYRELGRVGELKPVKTIWVNEKRHEAPGEGRWGVRGQIPSQTGWP